MRSFANSAWPFPRRRRSYGPGGVILFHAKLGKLTNEERALAALFYAILTSDQRLEP